MKTGGVLFVRVTDWSGERYLRRQNGSRRYGQARKRPQKQSRALRLDWTVVPSKYSNTDVTLGQLFARFEATNPNPGSSTPTDPCDWDGASTKLIRYPFVPSFAIAI